MKRSWSAGSTLLLLVAMLATSCATASGPAVVAPSTSSSPTGSGALPEILDFEAPLVGGGTFRGAELAGAPIAIWFWAPW